MARNKKVPIFLETEYWCWLCVSHCRDDCWYTRIYKQWHHKRLFRYMYEIRNGDIQKWLVLRHKCDNPRCCNPEHLEVWTQKDNWDDMKERWNPFWWESHYFKKWDKPRNTKLTESDARFIRYSNMSNKELLKKYPNISKTTIRAIKNNKSWKNI